MKERFEQNDLLPWPELLELADSDHPLERKEALQQARVRAKHFLADRGIIVSDGKVTEGLHEAVACGLVDTVKAPDAFRALKLRNNLYYHTGAATREEIKAAVDAIHSVCGDDDAGTMLKPRQIGEDTAAFPTLNSSNGDGLTAAQRELLSEIARSGREFIEALIAAGALVAGFVALIGILKGLLEGFSESKAEPAPIAAPTKVPSWSLQPQEPRRHGKVYVATGCAFWLLLGASLVWICYLIAKRL